MAVDLLAPSIEIGVVTTNLDALVAFYEGFLGLPHQGTAPGGGRAQAGLRYITLVVSGVRKAAGQAADAGYEVPEPPTDFAAVPGMGWCFVADPDGNWVELVGPV